MIACHLYTKVCEICKSLTLVFVQFRQKVDENDICTAGLRHIVVFEPTVKKVSVSAFTELSIFKKKTIVGCFPYLKDNYILFRQLI